MRLLTLFLHRSILYQAFKCPEKLVGHAGGIASDVEAGTHFHGSEVRAVRAVVLAGDGDVLAAVDLRVALFNGFGDGLDEGEVVVVEEILTLDVATEHARVALAVLHVAVAAQLRLQIHAQVRVVVPNLKHF